MAPDEMPFDRSEFGAMLELVNEAALKRLDDTMAALQWARRDVFGGGDAGVRR